MSNPSLKAADYNLQDPEQLQAFLDARTDDAVTAIYNLHKEFGVDAALAALAGLSVGYTCGLEIEIQKLQARINELEA